jgi:hypothetical protein
MERKLDVFVEKNELRSTGFEKLRDRVGWGNCECFAMLFAFQSPVVGTPKIVHYYVSLLLFAMDLGCVGMYSILVGFGRRLTLLNRDNEGSPL